jgi:hypothetical protein
VVALLAGCPAVYPEMKTPVRPATGDLEAPPAELRWVAFKGATIPRESDSSRAWGVVGDAAPDPYAILFLNGEVLIKTPVQSNTYEPTWPGAPSGNFWIHDKDRLRVELWNSNPVKDRPIGVRDLGSLGEAAKTIGTLDVDWSSGAQLRIAVEPAHARVGYGLTYDLRVGEAYVVGTFEQCPASRAGIRAGDQILSVNGKLVAQMVEGELQTLMNSPKPQGIAIKVRHEDKQELTVTLKEGAIFPLYSEDKTLR